MKIPGCQKSTWFLVSLGSFIILYWISQTVKQSVGNKSTWRTHIHKLNCKRTDKITLEVIKHLGDPKPASVFLVNKFGASGAATIFVEAREGSDDELQTNLCVILKDEVQVSWDWQSWAGWIAGVWGTYGRFPLLPDRRSWLDGLLCSSLCHHPHRAGCWHRDVFHLGMNRHSPWWK